MEAEIVEDYVFYDDNIEISFNLTRLVVPPTKEIIQKIEGICENKKFQICEQLLNLTKTVETFDTLLKTMEPPFVVRSPFLDNLLGDSWDMNETIVFSGLINKHNYSKSFVPDELIKSLEQMFPEVFNSSLTTDELSSEETEVNEKWNAVKLDQLKLVHRQSHFLLFSEIYSLQKATGAMETICQNSILSESLIPSEMLLERIQEVRSSLPSDVQIAISDENINKYYQLHLARCQHESSHLSIFLNVPLLRKKSDFRMVKFIGKIEEKSGCEEVFSFDEISKEISVLQGSHSVEWFYRNNDCGSQGFCDLTKSKLVPNVDDALPSCVRETIEGLFSGKPFHELPSCFIHCAGESTSKLENPQLYFLGSPEGQRCAIELIHQNKK